MADDSATLAARIKALSTARLPGGSTAAPPATVAAPQPGFRFGLGAPVLELVNGERGTVRAAYYSAAQGGPMYEIAISGHGIVARLERELEPDRPLAPAPPAPR